MSKTTKKTPRRKPRTAEQQLAAVRETLADAKKLIRTPAEKRRQKAEIARLNFEAGKLGVAPPAPPPAIDPDKQIDENTGLVMHTLNSIDRTLASLDAYNDVALGYAAEKLDAMLTQVKENRRREKKYEEQGDSQERFVEAVRELLEDAEYMEAAYSHAAALAAIDSVLHETRSKDYLAIRHAWKGPAADAYIVRFAQTHMGVDLDSVIEQLTKHRDKHEAEAADGKLANAVNDAIWNDNPVQGDEHYHQLNMVFKAVKSRKRVDSKGRVREIHAKA